MYVYVSQYGLQPKYIMETIAFQRFQTPLVSHGCHATPLNRCGKTFLRARFVPAKAKDK